MPWLKKNFLMQFGLVVIFLIGGYWFLSQKNKIESLAQEITEIKPNQNSPFGIKKDYILMKRELINSQNTLYISGFQFVSSLLLVFTAYTAWRNFVISEKKQIVESFAKAVEQLGNEELHTRVGAIFVLEQIAQGSPEYHWIVIEVLTSYIRDLSIKEESTSKPEIKENFSARNDIEKEKFFLGEKIHKRLQEIREEPAISVTIDIQAALTVICRRNIKHDPQDKKVIDLRFCDIRGANIKNAKLRYANLTGAKISRIQLENADLSSARLRSADLTEANLNGANLNESDFSDATLTEANFEDCSLKKAIFSGPDLRGVNFKNANLEEAIFNNPIEQVNLEGANFENVRLEKAKFIKSILSKTSFCKANLKKAVFEFCDYNETNFQRADNIEEATFRGSTKGAVFSNLNKEKANSQDVDI